MPPVAWRSRHRPQSLRCRLPEGGVSVCWGGPGSVPRLTAGLPFSGGGAEAESARGQAGASQRWGAAGRGDDEEEQQGVAARGGARGGRRHGQVRARRPRSGGALAVREKQADDRARKRCARASQDKGPPPTPCPCASVFSGACSRDSHAPSTLSRPSR